MNGAFLLRNKKKRDGRRQSLRSLGCKLDLFFVDVTDPCVGVDLAAALVIPENPAAYQTGFSCRFVPPKLS